MQPKDQTASYVELSSNAYSLFVEAYASANKRALDYTKSVWEIASRPYASSALETAVRENFDRVNQVFSLTLTELQTNGQQSAELAEKVVAQTAKVQESLSNTLKGLVDTSISNMKYAKDAATAQIDDITKRIEDAQSRATVSTN